MYQSNFIPAKHLSSDINTVSLFHFDNNCNDASYNNDNCSLHNGASYSDLGVYDIYILSPDLEMFIDVRFKPDAVGDHNGFINLSSNDPDTPVINYPIYGAVYNWSQIR